MFTLLWQVDIVLLEFRSLIQAGGLRQMFYEKSYGSDFFYICVSL